MAVSKAAALVLILSLFASANAQVYFNKAVPAKVSDALATSNEILCTYLNVNCAPGETGFNTPPLPPPTVPGPGMAPGPMSPPAPVVPPTPVVPSPTQLDPTQLQALFGRKLRL